LAAYFGVYYAFGEPALVQVQGSLGAYGEIGMQLIIMYFVIWQSSSWIPIWSTPE
jgi:hypothetical protein